MMNILLMTYGIDEETEHLSKSDFFHLLLGECSFQGQGFLSHDGAVALEEISVSGCGRWRREIRRDRGGGVGRLIVGWRFVSVGNGCCLGWGILRRAG